jgi:hypothetical protein
VLRLSPRAGLGGGNNRDDKSDGNDEFVYEKRKKAGAADRKANEPLESINIIERKAFQDGEIMIAKPVVDADSMMPLHAFVESRLL